MNIQTIKRKNASAGFHWFSKDTMSFFGTIVHSKIYNNKFFITSESRNVPTYHLDNIRNSSFTAVSSERLYTIRQAHEDGSISTVGEFQAYKSLDAAIAAIGCM